MDLREQKIVLETFLHAHGVEMLPTARLSHYGRRFSRFFPTIAEQANPSDARWTKEPIARLCEIVKELEPEDYARAEAARDFKTAKKYKKVSKTQAFLHFSEWKQLRYEVLATRGRNGECCGRGPGDAGRSGRVRIEVAHIKPISKFWTLRLDVNNLQVLCRDCNTGKSNKRFDDFRG